MRVFDVARWLSTAAGKPSRSSVSTCASGARAVTDSAAAVSARSPCARSAMYWGVVSTCWVSSIGGTASTRRRGLLLRPASATAKAMTGAGKPRGSTPTSISSPVARSVIVPPRLRRPRASTFLDRPTGPTWHSSTVSSPGDAATGPHRPPDRTEGSRKPGPRRPGLHHSALLPPVVPLNAGR